jgi:hypothetical protein
LQAQFTAAAQYNMAPIALQKSLSISSKTPYYLVQMNSSNTLDIRMANAAIKMIIRAVCAYL